MFCRVLSKNNGGKLTYASKIKKSIIFCKKNNFRCSIFCIFAVRICFYRTKQVIVSNGLF